MTKIITITLNPCIDKSTVVPSLIADTKLRCTETKFEPGGGGINVSRAIKKLGSESTAYFLAGGSFGNFFIELMKQRELACEAFKIKKETRENLILFDKLNSHQYLLGMEGPFVEEQEWKGFLQAITNINTADFIVASGSLSPGIPIDFYGRLAKIAKNKNAKFILDTSGEALEIAINEGVYLIKPNLRELGMLASVHQIDMELAKEKAMELLSTKKCTAIVVSLGADGAMLVNDGRTVHIPSPLVDKKSTVGAGDSMVAGIVLSLSKNKSLHDAVTYGVACGAAATLNAGSALCKKEDADALFLDITKIERSINK
jgi:6-phosphofructokinase 2